MTRSNEAMQLGSVLTWLKLSWNSLPAAEQTDLAFLGFGSLRLNAGCDCADGHGFPALLGIVVITLCVQEWGARLEKNTAVIQNVG